MQGLQAAGCHGLQAGPEDWQSWHGAGGAAAAAAEAGKGSGLVCPLVGSWETRLLGAALSARPVPLWRTQRHCENACQLPVAHWCLQDKLGLGAQSKKAAAREAAKQREREAQHRAEAAAAAAEVARQGQRHDFQQRAAAAAAARKTEGQIRKAQQVGCAAAGIICVAQAEGVSWAATLCLRVYCHRRCRLCSRWSQPLRQAGQAEGRVTSPVNFVQVCETLDTAAGIHDNVLWALPPAAAAGAASAAAQAAAAAADDLLEQCEPCHKAEAGAAIRAAREEAADCSRLFAAHAEAAAAAGAATGAGNRDASMGPPAADRQPGGVTAGVVSEDEDEQRRLQDWEAFQTLPAAERLAQLLAYLRDRHCYCLFCGCRYEDPPDMQQHCPGPSEADHE